MKKNDLVKYHQMSVEEITKEVEKIQQEIIDVRIQKELNQLKDVHQEKSLKTSIAQLKTIIRMKQLTSNQKA